MKNLDDCWSVLYIETSFTYAEDEPMKDLMTMEFQKKEAAMNFIRQLRESSRYQVIGVFKSFYIDEF